MQMDREYIISKIKYWEDQLHKIGEFTPTRFDNYTYQQPLPFRKRSSSRYNNHYSRRGHGY
jgi:hypothetical protein